MAGGWFAVALTAGAHCAASDGAEMDRAQSHRDRTHCLASYDACSLLARMFCLFSFLLVLFLTSNTLKTNASCCCCEQEFKQAVMRYWTSPPINWLYADTNNNIARISAARIPKRAPAHKGAAPAAGWLSAMDWRGYEDIETATPVEFNPPSGMIVTANDAVRSFAALVIIRGVCFAYVCVCV